MSLVGSLEDLGLGDILQIISLSRKSGVLVLRTEHGEGQILFDAGLIRCAHAKGSATELRDLLASQEALAPEALEAAAQDARSRGCPLAEVLAGRGLLSAEALDQIRRDHIEAAVFEMFGWNAGEFSFEVREVEDDGGGLFATPGINPQFLALEGTRRVDEDAHEEGEGEELAFGIIDDEPDVSPDPSADESSLPPAAIEGALEDPFAAADPGTALEPVDTPELEGASVALDPLTEVDAVAVAEDADAETEALAQGTLAAAADVVAEAVVEEMAPPEGVLSEDDLVEPADAEARAQPTDTPLAGAGDEGVAPASALPGPVPEGPIRRPLVLIDPDLRLLEWAKEALGGTFTRVHIFQRTDLGIQRIRQYLARAEVPVVVLSVDAPADPVSGARDPMEVAARLRKQSPRISIALWRTAEDPAPQGAQALVQKPTPTQLADPRRAADRQQLGLTLTEELARLSASGGESARPAPGGESARPAPGGDLKRLRETSARIREGASQGEVLPQVLSFAAQTFARVALFMIRDDQAVGIAQSGLPKAGGPDDQALRGVHLGCRESAALRRVIDTRKPIRVAPTDEGDQRLCVMLGNEIPDDLYVAPIESADHVVALLVGDNLPSREPIGDTGALEVLLDSAGIALDRALLERTLAESEG